MFIVRARLAGLPTACTLSALPQRQKSNEQQIPITSAQCLIGAFGAGIEWRPEKSRRDAGASLCHNRRFFPSGNERQTRRPPAEHCVAEKLTELRPECPLSVCSSARWHAHRTNNLKVAPAQLRLLLSASKCVCSHATAVSACCAYAVLFGFLAVLRKNCCGGPMTRITRFVL